jgi:general secretion pathway protein H
MATRGFTLLELLLVLAIAGLMLTIVPPFLSRGIAATKLNTSAREVAAAMRTARSQAVTRRRETTLTVDIDKRLYKLSGKARAQHLDRDIKVKLDTVQSERLSDSVGAFRFFPDGSATGGQVTLSSGKSKIVIDLNWLTGRVAIYN